MSINAVEKHAQTLNQALRNQGKLYGKAWRLRIRDLLQQTFAAMNARPLDGELCKALDEKISAELEALENGTVEIASEEPKKEKRSKKKRSLDDADEEKPVLSGGFDEDAAAGGAAETAEIVPEPVVETVETAESEAQESSRMAAGQSDEGETRMAAGHSGAGDTSPETKTETDEIESESGEATTKAEDDSIGLFDLIHVEIRCFFKIRACVRPPYIGQFVTFSERYAADVQTRIDQFLGVLSKGDDEFAAKTEVDVGYRDDLLPNMPERGLILYPKKKKKR